jgi:hypothetical protein
MERVRSKVSASLAALALAAGALAAAGPSASAATTLWIPLTADASGGFEPLINGSDTVVNTPYVLTCVWRPVSRARGGGR